jgi:hypothetical protein
MAPNPLAFLVSLLIVFSSLYSAWLITRTYGYRSRIIFLVLVFCWPVTWIMIPVHIYRRIKAKKE